MNSQITTNMSPDELAALVAEKVMAIISHQQANTPKPEARTGYLSRKEVADKLHINLKTVNEWTKAGKLKGYRIGRRVLYKAHEIDAALSAINVKSGKQI
jgi:excisionase family DNA binding protein